MKHVLRVVNALAVVVIVVALVVLLCATFTPAGEVPTIGGYGILRTLTGSMEPAIPVHSLVVVQQTDPAELQVGDIITFEATEGALDDALNTHRIVQIDEGSAGPVFHTKGDANAVEDAQTVSADHVIGRVVFVSAGLGVIVSLLTNPLLFFPLIVVPLAVLLVLEIRKMVKSAREVAQAEEQAALAEAVEIIKRQREKQAEQEAGEQPADAAGGGGDGLPASERGEADEASESDSLEEQ